MKIYFEGHRTLRSGFTKFLAPIRDIAARRQIDINLVNGDSKWETVRDFVRAVRTDDDTVHNMLLVDSDKAVSNTSSMCEEIRRGSTWDNAVVVDDRQLHFMVQVMESWFLADKSALEDYYGRSFRTNRLPSNPNVEQIQKADVESGLRSATRETGKGADHKTRHAPDLLARIDPSRVRSVAPHCDRLFRELGQALA